MEDDRDAESQGSNFAPLSSSWWLMQSLWQSGVSDDRRLRIGLVDTILLQDGHLMSWYFTSSKSGLVLKRDSKRCEWEGLMRFLIRRAKGTWGSGNDHWNPGVIATARRLRGDQMNVVMLTAADINSLRQKHNLHLLDEIVALQPYFTRKSFKGCGLFETTLTRKGGFRDAQMASMTYELAQWSENRTNGSTTASTVPSPEGCGAQSHDDGPGSRCEDASEGNRGFSDSATGRSAYRVHGVLHRVLSTTAKDLVSHLERETGEALLQLVAQYAFRPGSGKPTLLWLDRIKTLRSTHGNQSEEKDEHEANRGFVQQTLDWREVDKGWTTFFPPKVSELGCLDTLAGGGAPLQNSLDILVHKDSSTTSSHQERQVDNNSATDQPPEDHRPADIISSTATQQTMGLPEMLPAGHKPRYTTTTADHVQSRSESCDGDGVVIEEWDLMNGRGGQLNLGHFALPTESWTNRSAGLRGLYFTHGAGAGRGALTSRDRWPRKRSTGTTMRVDSERPDLRRSSEVPRPSTAPARLTEAMRHGMRGTECLPMDAISHRLSKRSNGCFGDFCQYAIAQPCHSTSHGYSTSETKPSKLVSYKSILKCRAEERASEQKSELGLPVKHATLGNSLPIPAVRADSKDADEAFRKAQAQLARVVAARMQLLASCLNQEGRAEYSRFRSADRRWAGTPEAAQRATEELLYEKALSHLHPTTRCRPVAVCDNCAMVYGLTDMYRKKAHRLKEVAHENNRLARAAWRRQQQQVANRYGHDRSRPSTAPVHSTRTPTARRYSDLNLACASAS